MEDGRPVLPQMRRALVPPYVVTNIAEALRPGLRQSLSAAAEDRLRQTGMQELIESSSSGAVEVVYAAAAEGVAVRMRGGAAVSDAVAGWMAEAEAVLETFRAFRDAVVLRDVCRPPAEAAGHWPPRAAEDRDRDGADLDAARRQLAAQMVHLARSALLDREDARRLDAELRAATATAEGGAAAPFGIEEARAAALEAADAAERMASDLQELRALRAGLDAELLAAQEAVGCLTDDLAQSKTKLRQAWGARKELRQAVARRDAELARVMGSVSIRATAPLRRLSTLLRLSR